VACGECFQLGDEVAVFANGEVGVDPALERDEAEFLQATDLGLGEGVVGDVAGRRRARPARPV
jgi:hypothetical protein